MTEAIVVCGWLGRDYLLDHVFRTDLRSSHSEILEQQDTLECIVSESRPGMTELSGQCTYR